MIRDLLGDKQFQNLSKEYKFLARARGESLDTLDYVVFDIETTGLDPTVNEITEIGALKLKGLEVVDMFSSLIKPKNPIPPEITDLTGIDNNMVAAAPPIEEVLPKFIGFAGAATLIAHNADFDLSFIKHHYKQLTNKEINNSVLCTLKLSRYLLSNLMNHKLHTVASHFGFTVQNRHRAMGDVELTYQVWLKFVDLLKEKGIRSKKELLALIA